MSTAETMQMNLPRPGRVLRILMVGLLAVWLAFAIAVNWAGAPASVFLLFCGNTELILGGEVFRLLTAPLMHAPDSPWHVLTALLGLYFLAPSLEQRWGAGRFVRFLVFSAVFAYLFQLAFELLLPATLSSRLVGEYWFGSTPVIEAIAIAWAMSFRGQTVNLFFVLPVSSRGLILFVVGASLMWLIAAAQTPSGLIAPFGGMLAGYLFGGGTPSPMRQAWLKLRLAQLDAEAQREAEQRRRRIQRSGLQVLPGGRKRDSDPDDDDRTGSGSNGSLLN